MGAGAFMTRAITTRTFRAAVVTAGGIGTRSVITTIIGTGLFAARLVLLVKFRAAMAVGTGTVGAVVAVGEGAAQFFHGALELLHLGAEIGITGGARIAGAGVTLCLEPAVGALTASLEVWPAEGAGLAVAAGAESEAWAVRKMGVVEAARAGMGLPGRLTAAIRVARTAAEVPAILPVLRTLRVVLQGLLDALGHVAKTGGTEVFERFFNVLAFFRGITGSLLRVAVGSVVVTGAGARLSALRRAFLGPGLRRWAGWLIGVWPRALGKGGGGETEGGEERDDAWCLHARVENRPRALVAKFFGATPLTVWKPGEMKKGGVISGTVFLSRAGRKAKLRSDDSGGPIVR